jgi:phosphatidylglycerol:prolipoprotein diacylglycerol transferase
VPYLALSQAIGRLGNFINVEAYGIPTNSMFRMGIFIDNGYIEVHPCFLYEMIGCFTIFIILKLLQKNQKYQGEILNFYMILYGVVRFVIEGLRADSLMLYNFKISQIISLIFVVLGIILYINNIFCRKKPKNVDEK